jgi:hypothetical protein
VSAFESNVMRMLGGIEQNVKRLVADKDDHEKRLRELEGKAQQRQGESRAAARFQGMAAGAAPGLLKWLWTWMRSSWGR